MRSLFIVLVLMTLGGCRQLQPEDNADLCRLFKRHHNWYQAAEKAEQRWGGSVAVAMAFIRQESGFNSRARPKRRLVLGFIPGARPSTAYGYAQALDPAWNQYINESPNPGARRSDFGDAIDFIGWYNAKSRERNRIAPHDVASLYLAYHEGQRGFERQSYSSKYWLLKVAETVRSDATRFDRQYSECRSALGHNWLSSFH